MRSPDGVGRPTRSDADQSDPRSDHPWRDSVGESSTARHRARFAPPTLVVPALVACALLTALGAQSLALLVGATVGGVDPATLRLLGVADALAGVVGSVSLVAWVGGAVACAGTAYTLARTGAWLVVRR